MSNEGKRAALATIERAVFQTITSDDWRRELATARDEKNPVAAGIRQKILALKLGKSESETIGKKDL